MFAFATWLAEVRRALRVVPPTVAVCAFADCRYNDRSRSVSGFPAEGGAGDLE
jgi:hypothetical protein